jgi:hypothetical protein
MDYESLSLWKMTIICNIFTKIIILNLFLVQFSYTLLKMEKWPHIYNFEKKKSLLHMTISLGGNCSLIYLHGMKCDIATNFISFGLQTIMEIMSIPSN